MKRPLLVFSAFMVLFIPTLTFGQSPDIGTTANFVLFSADGAVSNTESSQLTGKVGTNNGSNTGFGNVNGGMHSADGITAQAAADLLVVYDQLEDAIPTFIPYPLLGNGVTLNSGV
jgi:hypothetical protein